MRCPYCAHLETKVIDTRETSESIRRRRECLNCQQRFTTYERVAKAHLSVVKRTGEREEFDLEKLAAGIRKAVAKRPVPPETPEVLAKEIEAELLDLGRAELDSGLIGSLVMRRLRELDDVAYVRFASVYRRYPNVESLVEEIEEFREWKRREAELEAQLKLGL
ncbi:MAG: transcriptional repressor NrdR [Chloroflexi bacterium]|nr:transcriptional repressor NrdR [Chloroflexota bacterium]